tara:strand:- start:55 stop:489 length:435 start_codon:yes stop_codon:yes gene_type:complete
MLEEPQIVSKFISQNGGIGFINGTLKGGISSTPTSTPTRDLTYTLSNFQWDGITPGPSTYTSEDIAECITINSSTGVLNVNDQLLMDKFGVNILLNGGTNVYTVLGPNPLNPADTVNFTVTVQDAGNSGAGFNTSFTFSLILIS